MTRLAFRNLFQRKTRTALTLGAVATQVAFVLLLVGLTTGTLNEVGERIENVRSDVIVLPPGGQYILSMSSAVMPLEPVRSALEATPGVETAAPVVIATTSRFGANSMIFGIEPRSYNAVGRGAFRLLEGRGLSGADDLVVDRRLALAQGLKPGDRVALLNHRFEVAGVVQDGAGVRLYVSLATLQDLQGSVGKASLFFVRTRDRAAVPGVLERLGKSPAFKDYRLIASDRYSQLPGTSALGVKELVAAICTVSTVFGFLVISVVMYTTIVERTRQIGILKALGAARSFIARAFVLEALLLAVLGVPAGVVLAGLARAALTAWLPTLIITFSLPWLLVATAIALVAAAAGALYPAARAARVDPVIALSFE